MTKFEKEVRKTLIDREMSAYSLAEEIGISRTYLYDIFKGGRKGKKVKEKICKYLNLNIEDIE